MSGTIKRKRESKPLVSYTTGPVPTSKKAGDITKGIIVGKRTIREGQVKRHDRGVYFSPTEGKTKTVWLVAYSLSRNPVMCLAEQLYAADD